MLKKLFSVLLSAVMFVTMITSGFAAAPDTLHGKIAAIEIDVYGAEQSGAMDVRLNRLETDITGRHLNENMMARVNTLYEILYTNDKSPSMLAELNAIEWTINHEVNMTPIQPRLANLEMMIEGKTGAGSFEERIDSLGKLAFGSIDIPMEQVDVPANTLIKIALVTPVNAKTLKQGDTVEFKVAEDVLVNDCLIFAKGEPGRGKAAKVVQARNFGRDAEVVIDFEETKSLDGTYVDTFVGTESKEQMEHMAMAAGASIAGIVLLGPVGIIAGAFVKGKNIDLPAGTEVYIQTKSDSRIYGVRTVSDNL